MLRDLVEGILFIVGFMVFLAVCLAADLMPGSMP